ncbi:LysR family transcriptional regulator [Brevundimonas sp. SL130]|uniref:LysR family transcriptional regulator n=1 Tax=Brevundimonas sp. SL130 TaxID=2995143 RepID=UPI00226D12C3|nr:LysR family transcriptional regulator [Brevundimonas sp. SL130]WAC61299.1 LysR family transcriptional regulator [Brevundimonas sp. SL130]
MIERHDFETTAPIQKFGNGSSPIGGHRSFEKHRFLISRISMRTLVNVLTVAEFLNFRHAASYLGVSQSSVSTRIKALEDHLGTILFERRHRGVHLTEAGRGFVNQIAMGIEHLDHAITTAGAVSTGTIGQLRIGLDSSIASGFLADLRHRFLEKYTEIQIIITEGRATDTIRQVRDRFLDVAFTMRAIDLPDCHSRSLWSEPFVVAMPIHHPMATAVAFGWEDLASEKLLVRRGGAGPQFLNHITRRLAERNRTPNIQRFDVGRDTLMHMVADGEGIKLTTEAVASVPFPGIAFRRIADETEEAKFSAVWSPHNRSPALKNFLDLATEMSRSA